jgi:phage terminase large subunit GpA-like protein
LLKNEQEIVIPSGPYQGQRFRCDRQPYTRLWFDAVDSGQWNRYVATGPTQSGKTLACFIIPLLFHLFEMGETVICGLPDMSMAADKWNLDLLPVIERSRYKDLLPSAGGGSRGGRVESLTFANGATLKFMSGGGSDKSRAGFTSRVLVVTETDGMDRPGHTSRETDKIGQLEARTRAYGSKKRIYLECTVSTETGRTWQEYIHGTKSRIVLPCPRCFAWVSPERPHLIGWQGADNQQAAKHAGAFACPACGQSWNNEERISANRGSCLLHEGQTIDVGGIISGDPPATETLGFRWSAVNNLLLTAGEIAAEEWRASREVDEENADRRMKQFVWAEPVLPSKLNQTNLEISELASRVSELPRGVVPLGTACVTVGIDIGKFLCHWAAVAWSPNPTTPHLLDYGQVQVASNSLGIEPAVMIALQEMRDMFTQGWPIGTLDGERMLPQQVWVDAGFATPVIYAFVRESGDRFRPVVGRGAAQQHRDEHVGRTTQTGSVVSHVGEGYHACWLPTERLHLIQADSDHWKRFTHGRLSTPLGKPGAMTFFSAQRQEHLGLARHLTAEIKTEEFVAGKGATIRWQCVRRDNHWLDALSYACVAGHFCGVRLVSEQQPTQTKARPEPANGFISAAEYLSRGRHRW